LVERLERIDGMFLTEELKDYLLENFMPYEIPMFRKLAVGYAVMQENFDDLLEVGIDDELKRLMETSVKWRRRIYSEITDETGLGTDMVIQVLKLNKNEMSYNGLAEKLLLFEVSYGETDRYLKALREQKRVQIFQHPEKDEVWVRLIG